MLEPFSGIFVGRFGFVAVLAGWVLYGVLLDCLGFWLFGGCDAVGYDCEWRFWVGISGILVLWFSCLVF